MECTIGLIVGAQTVECPFGLIVRGALQADSVAVAVIDSELVAELQ